MNELELRKKLARASINIRKQTNKEVKKDPRFISYDNIRLDDGLVYPRKKVIVMSAGCSVPTCTMCPFTNENNYGLGARTVNLIDQVEEVLKPKESEPKYSVISIYNDGSFFARQEIPLETQLRIAELVSAAGVKRLVVESLPQFLTKDVLLPFYEKLSGVELEIGIGLQSSNDTIRETLINTRVTKQSFEDAVILLKEIGIISKVYLMIKPPFISEEEAITDVIESIDYLIGLDANCSVTLCPTRVSKNTIAWELHKAGLYTPPNLWTVIEILRAIHEKIAARVACINLRGTDFESVYSDSCPKCAKEIVDSLMKYSETYNIADLHTRCSCTQDFVPAKLNISKIINRTIDDLKVTELI